MVFIRFKLGWIDLNLILELELANKIILLFFIYFIIEDWKIEIDFHFLIEKEGNDFFLIKENNINWIEKTLYINNKRKLRLINFLFFFSITNIIDIVIQTDFLLKIVF